MKLTRRMVLKGIGGTVLALPVLESIVPDHAEAADPVEPFAVFFRQANGVGCAQNSEIGMEPERFWPRTEGPLTPESLVDRATGELVDWRDKLLIVGNVNMNGFPYGDGHARGALQGLTAQGPTVPEAGGDSEAAGESLDHRIGRELNPSGNESLFMYAGVNSGWLGGACISYRGPENRRAALHNPWDVYQSIVSGDVGMSPEATMQIAERKRSVNDLVRDQLTRIMSRPELSSDDRRRLQLHLDSVRDLEVTLTCRMTAEAERELMGMSHGYDSTDGDEVLAAARLHMDVAALAIACGYTRSVAIQIGSGNDGSTHYHDPDTGDRMENYHYISHRRLSHDSSGTVIPGSDILHHKVDVQFARTFRHLLERLDAYEMPDGQRLLDHGLAVWYNDNANGPGHSPRGVPFILGGSAGGLLKQGEFVRLPGGSDTPTHRRMLQTIGTAVGLRSASGGDILDDFGDASLPGGIASDLLV